MSRQHVTVALSGEGTDELFAGYVTYLADRWARPLRRMPAAARRATLDLVRHWPTSDEKISFEYKLKRFLEGSLLTADQAHLFWNGTFSEAGKRVFFPTADDLPLRSLLNQMPASSNRHLNRYLWFDQRYYLPDNILYKVDRMSMAHSLEVRPPFLDHRIVEFAASLPEHFKIRRFRQKYILKQLMKSKLPPGVLRRKKVGFDIPTHDWFRGPLRPLLLDTVTAEAVKQTGLFRWDGIGSLIDDHMKRRANLGYHLWGLMTLFLWMKRWKIETVPVDEEREETWDSVLTTT